MLFWQVAYRNSLSVIKNAYERLLGTEKHCKVLADEIHIKQGAQYSGRHLIRFFSDESGKLAKTFITLMIVALMEQSLLHG